MGDLCGWRPTIDGNSHDFAQDEAIWSNESRDPVQRVQLEVLGIGVGRTGLNKLDVEVVCFCDGEKHG